MLTLKETRTTELLLTLSIVPLLTTNQIAQLMFKDHGSPGKRASELLSEMEAEKLVEGQRMGDMRKVWRLSRRGRVEADCSKRPVPFNVMKIRHWLTIGDVYIALAGTGKKLHFETELREPFKAPSKEKPFAPDVFFIFGGKAYLMEVQLRRMSKEEWKVKWKRWNEYFNSGHYKQASWQRFKKDGGLIPQMIALSNQGKEIVCEGFSVTGRGLKIICDIQKLMESVGDPFNK